MKRILTIAFVIITFFPIKVLLSQPNIPDKPQINRLSFDLRSYLIDKKGYELANITSTRSLNLFEKYKSYALYYSEDKLLELGLYDIIFTLMIRNIFTPNELINANKEDIFAAQYFRLNSGLSVEDEPYFSDVNIITKNTATSRLYYHKSPKSSVMYYIKENGYWKVDFYPIFEQMEVAMNDLGKDAIAKGYNLKDFASYMMESQFPIVKNNIWLPMNR